MMIKKFLKKNDTIMRIHKSIKVKRIRHTLQKKGLVVLSEVTGKLNESGITAFSDFGTLLGIVREGALLEHDLDMDVGVVLSEPNRNTVISKVFDSMGYIKSREFTVNGDIKEQSYIKNGIKVDIQYYFRDDDKELMYCYLFYNPSRDSRETKWKSVIKKCPMVNQVENITVQGNNIFIPKNAEAILRYKYGSNWRTPDKGWVYWEGPNTYPREEFGVLDSIYLRQ